MLEAHVTGLDDINEVLSSLPNRIGKQVLAATLKQAAKPTLEAAQANAAAFQKTGRFARSFTIKTTLSRRQKRLLRGSEKSQAVMYVGSTDRKAHLIEFGTGPHPIAAEFKEALAGKEGVYGTTVFHPGTPARPVLRPAWEATKEQVLKRFGELIWRQIEKAKARMAKKA